MEMPITIDGSQLATAYYNIRNNEHTIFTNKKNTIITDSKK